MVTLTQAAATEIRKIIEENKLPKDTGLRLGVKGGGCAGYTYTFDFSNTHDEFDKCFESHNIPIFIDRKSYIYIKDIEIDFAQSLMERGFKFNNPNANAACGCGTSFSPKNALT